MDMNNVFVYKNTEKQHKPKPAQLMSVTHGVLNPVSLNHFEKYFIGKHGVQRRLEQNIKHRKTVRLTNFDSGRALTEPTPVKLPKNDAVDKVEQRRQKLEQWKQEKEQRKKEAMQNKKKPFILGAAVAPLSKKFESLPPIKTVPNTSGRVTRSQARKKEEKPQYSFAPTNAKFHPPQLKTTIPKMAPVTKKTQEPVNLFFKPSLPKVSKMADTAKSKATKETVKKAETARSTRNRRIANVPEDVKTTNIKQETNKEQKKVNKKQETEIAPKKRVTNKSVNCDLDKPEPKCEPVLRRSTRNSISTPAKPVPKSESSSEEKLRSPLNRTPEQSGFNLSPYVTLSRGKENARREMLKKLDEGLLDEDASDMESVGNFRSQLNSEVQRITAMCDMWDEIFEEMELPENVQELILAAVGQSRLLMSQKFQQFRSLVDRCETSDTSKGLITPADLQGFWDMLFIQIENIDMRFKRLDELKQRNWIIEEPKKQVKKAVVKANKRNSKQTNKPKPSMLKEMIAAARKAQLDSASNTSMSSPSSISTTTTSSSKKFDAGFFSVTSPVRSPSVHTPIKNNLLKTVLSSEAKKVDSARKNSASFAMLRASFIGKDSIMDGVSPIEQTPKPVEKYLEPTPGRSILKSANKKPRRSSKKSIKTVLFDQSDENENQNPNKDSGLSSMEAETKKQEPRKKKLSRQSAIDNSTDNAEGNKENSKHKTRRSTIDNPENKIMTRSRRKSIQAEVILTEIDNLEETPKRDKKNFTPRRSLRKSSIDLINFDSPEPITRRRNKKSNV